MIQVVKTVAPGGGTRLHAVELDGNDLVAEEAEDVADGPHELEFAVPPAHGLGHVEA